MVSGADGTTINSCYLSTCTLNNVNNIKIQVLDLDNSPASIAITEKLAHNPRFTMGKPVKSMLEVQYALIHGDIVLAVVIPKEFSIRSEQALPDADILDKEKASSILFLVDGQDAATAATAAGYASAIINQWASLQSIDLRDKILFNPELEYSWYMVCLLYTSRCV